jgi:PIN domain nuclease of toxin-antitoxin system
MFRILPLTCEIASAAASFHILRDPADRTIAATARVHGLQLLTSDRRIIQSKLLTVVE